MSASIKLVDKLERVENFHAWKYRIGLILEENDLARFIKEELLEPDDAAEKAKHQKDTIRAKRIIADSIKDHLIPYVSSKKTPKEMFDALTRLHERKNINRKMNLRTQLKNTRMQKGEMIQEYFSRISEFKEQLEAIGNTIDEDELKWSHKTLGCFHPNDMCQKGETEVRQPIGRMHPRRNKSRES
jgi:hypothetical protein